MEDTNAVVARDGRIRPTQEQLARRRMVATAELAQLQDKVTGEDTAEDTDLPDNGEDNFCDFVNDIMPLPAPRRRSQSIPGVVWEGRDNSRGDDACESQSAVDTLESGVEHEEDCNISETAALESGTAHTEENHHENNLVVARLVGDQEDSDRLPQAVQFDSTTESGRRPKQVNTRRTLWISFLLTILLMAVLFMVVVVVVTVINRRDSTSDARDNSMAPSQAPATTRDYVLSLLPQGTIAAIAHDADSPQAEALRWLVAHDEDLLTQLDDNRMRQRMALATLYFATDGDNWANNSNWLDDSISECEWYNKPDFAMKDIFGNIDRGYIMFPPANIPPPACDSLGIYRHLWLDENNLVGDLPDEVYLLTSLRTLSLGYNRLQGTISNGLIGQMTSLEGLALNGLETNGGSIPSEIGLLTTMRALKLGKCGFQSTIPRELWQLTNLQHLQLSYNPQLIGTISSEVSQLSKLFLLSVPGCGLTGTSVRWKPMLFSHSQYVAKPSFFSPCNPYLAGTIPTEIGQLSSLGILVFPENRLTGTIPSEIGKLTNIVALSLYVNGLEGTLPTELGLLTASERISLRDNQLSGRIPSEMGLLTNLTIALNLRNNTFLSGTIPSELGHLSLLREMALSGNQITGSIPSELGMLVSIGHLGLANNSLSGTIPQGLSLLQQSLHTVHLEGNSMLSGIVPEGICVMNGTCIASTSLHDCEGPFGLSFDCTSLLCGCDSCACGAR